MIGNKRIWGSHEARQGSFKKYKKGKFVVLISIGLIVAFTTMNIQLASADITETVYCTLCHEDDMPNTWISVTVDSQTPSDITYYVTGSDTFDGEEGWTVFDSLQNNIANGHNSGYFTLPLDGLTYKVFWVDNGTGGGGISGGGTAYEDIITPTNLPPGAPDIDGPTNGAAGTSYPYTFTSTDPEDEDVSYYIEWGDGSTTDWTAFQASGTSYSGSHTWSTEGTYTITAKAKDANGEGPEGTLTVTMPRNKAFNFNFNLLELLFESFPHAFPIIRILLGL